jgi:tetratricopeptide (TPR) repeat protein
VPPQPEPVPPAPAPVAVTSAAEYHDRGRKFIQQEKYPEAIEPLTQAVKLDPFLSQAFNARGYAYFRMKRYKEAIADFDQAIKLNPTYTNAYVNRGSARRAAGDKQGGDADQAKVRELMKMTAK